MRHYYVFIHRKLLMPRGQAVGVLLNNFVPLGYKSLRGLLYL